MVNRRLNALNKNCVWWSSGLRQKVVARLEREMKRCKLQENCTELEKTIFTRSESKIEYVQAITALFKHLKGIARQKQIERKLLRAQKSLSQPTEENV